MKKFLKSPYTITIIGGLVVLVIWSLISDHMSGDRLLTMLTNIWTWICSTIVSFLNFNIKVWWLLIAILVFIAIWWIVVKITKKKQLQKSEWLNYTSDVIDGFHWRWRWENIYGNTYDIENLHSICLGCQTPLVQTGFSYNRFSCPRCKKEINGENLNIRNIEIIIKDNVDKMIDEENDIS